MYSAASAKPKCEAPMARWLFCSKRFKINRGVIQGDIVSPLYFILAFELILKRHDTRRDKGIMFGGRVVSTLGYADDAALLDHSSAVATDRVTSIANGSRKDADMEISIAKTEVMQVREQDRVPRATAEEAANVCKHVCPHAGCGKVFLNIHAMKCHAGRCRRRDWDNIMERILDVRGPTGSPKRRFLVRRKCLVQEGDTWEPRCNLHPDEIAEFLIKLNGLYDYNWKVARCPYCDKPSTLFL